jgi:hypothetical protein
MKTTLIACLCLGSFAQAFEVNEWGTFTVLSGSEGSQVPWYASYHDIARLPDFILPNSEGKAGVSRVRMETPVIYFYPNKEMKVSVHVAFSNGSITETFPHSLGGNITGNTLVDGKWTGTLHPPTDTKAVGQIPAIPHTENAEPYAAAREVPDAWIFESDLKEIPGIKVQPKFPQMEKFIFYRGAGNAHIPISAMIVGETATLTNQNDEALAFGTALRVRDGKAAWVAIPPIAGRPARDTPAMNRAQIALPKPERSLAEVESELADAWKKALADDGLTPAEASAMVETWRKTWFRENGDRILTLVPRKTIDNLLPLKITPAPTKMNRVFVARIELISSEREESLVALLNTPEAVGEQEFAKFNSLRLGRFSNGAMTIATNIQSQRMMAKFYELTQFGKNLNTSEH